MLYDDFKSFFCVLSSNSCVGGRIKAVRSFKSDEFKQCYNIMKISEKVDG
jgi:hypothetical protein